MLVKIEVLDLSKQVIETSETEVLSCTKMKPFKLKRETLTIDLENYRDIVEKAKSEFGFLRRLDFTTGLIKNENPIKTGNVKRANRERDQTGAEVIRNNPWSGSSNKHLFFSKKNLNLLEISTCVSNTLRASYFAEFQFESHTLFEAKLHTARFPIEFYGRPFDPEMPDFLLSKEDIKAVYPTKKDFPSAFNPLEMPMSHFSIGSKGVQMDNY